MKWPDPKSLDGVLLYSVLIFSALAVAGLGLIVGVGFLLWK